MPELANWLLVFLRASAMLAVFPIFSSANFPVQLRLALGALLAALISPSLPAAPEPTDLWGGLVLMVVEIGVGLIIGYSASMIFYALDMAGSIVSSEIGLQLPPALNPMNGTSVAAPGMILYYLAAIIWLSLDLHHWMLAGFQKTYLYLPMGGAHLSKLLVKDIVERTSLLFVVALQLTAPILAVSFIISLVFSVLGRAVSQMNVFADSFIVRTLAGLAVFGFTLQLMSQHITNYLRRLPEDMLRVAQLLGGS